MVLVRFIDMLVQLITLAVIVQVILSYFVSPYHPVRQGFDRVIEPMLRPIRRFVPPVAGLDFSPMILLIFIQLSGKILVELLLRIFS